MEKFLHWHHCHKRECKIHPVSCLILLGDGIHNFVDGLIIAAGFLISPEFGVITSLLIFLHEIPQELGDFAVLVYYGMERKKALLLNFLSQLTCVLGGIAGFMLGGFPEFGEYAVPFAVGGFIYIAASDLILELHREPSMRRSLLSFFFFLLGSSPYSVRKG